ncbi:MAG TPA: hypothetical protein ENI90_07280 [Methylothermaceae bacterium]|nr:hypothetical protein [Methylothermaceae bacterium]
MTVVKIVSGGQTGVDRAALDTALELGLPCGGWCPAGRMAEDGPIPCRYPVRELAGAGYRQRTRANVADSDATLIIYFEELEGGTAATLHDCLELGKPFKLIDGAEIAPRQGARAVDRFLRRHGIGVLNVAGPRASKSPRAYRYARELLTAVLSGQRTP